MCVMERKYGLSTAVAATYLADFHGTTTLLQKSEEGVKPIVAVCTLSRTVENRRPPRPMLADLKETGDLEYDADVVLLIYWEGRYDPDSPRQFVTEVITAKHRDGPTGTTFLRRGGQGQLSDLVQVPIELGGGKQ